ncbi:MAG: DUF2183 domain-containing protein [Phycisphaerales bacterium]|nr:DUF2183 domain-containing protein [Phycisphaerales bacterium]
MNNALLAIASVVAGLLGAGTEEARSQIKSDEEIIFFPTLAVPAADGDTWELPIHGWIFEREWENKLVLRWAAQQGVGEDALTPEQARTLQERARWFVLDSERSKDIQVRIAGKVAAVGTSEEDGHFQSVVQLTAEELAQAVQTRGALRVVPFRAIMREGDEREFSGQVVIVQPAGLSIVSDIDDTIKITEVHDRDKLIENTFFEPMEAVPGMAAFYRALAARSPHPDFHYVSASPWQLYQPLQKFLDDSGFPAGSVHLRRLGISLANALDGFVVPDDYKEQRIAEIIGAFPERQFMLIGDASERDPEAYAALAKRFPRQVVKIMIRATPGNPPDSPRFEEVFANLPNERWQVYAEAPNALVE